MAVQQRLKYYQRGQLQDPLYGRVRFTLSTYARKHKPVSCALLIEDMFDYFIENDRPMDQEELQHIRKAIEAFYDDHVLGTQDNGMKGTLLSLFVDLEPGKQRRDWTKVIWVDPKIIKATRQHLQELERELELEQMRTELRFSKHLFERLVASRGGLGFMVKDSTQELPELPVTIEIPTELPSDYVAPNSPQDWTLFCMEKDSRQDFILND